MWDSENCTFFATDISSYTFLPSLCSIPMVFIGYVLSPHFVVHIDEERTPEIWFSYSPAVGQAYMWEELVWNILSYKLVRNTLFGSPSISMTFFWCFLTFPSWKGKVPEENVFLLYQNVEAESFYPSRQYCIFLKLIYIEHGISQMLQTVQQIPIRAGFQFAVFMFAGLRWKDPQVVFWLHNSFCEALLLSPTLGN